jgi:hypothetical protein
VVSFTPWPLYPRLIAPGIHWIGAVLDAVVKRKIPSPRREPNPRTPIVQHVAQRYTKIYKLIKREQVMFFLYTIQ